MTESERELNELVQKMEGYDVSRETSTVVAQDFFREIFNQAREDEADLVLMEWDEVRRWVRSAPSGRWRS